MSVPQVNINRQNGRLAAAQISNDGIVGLAYLDSAYIDAGTFPSGFSSTDRIKQVFALADVEALGIVADSAVNTTKVVYEHCKQFYDLGGAELWIGLFDDNTGAPDFVTELKNLQEASTNSLRIVGVWTGVTYIETQVASVHTALSVLDSEIAPLQGIYVADGRTLDIMSVTDYPDLTQGNNYRVSVLVGEGQVGSRTGDLAVSVGKTVGALGAAIGLVSLNKVSSSIANVASGDIAGLDLGKPAFADGTSSIKSLSTLNNVSNRGYVFLMKHTGRSGTYFSSEQTATAPANSDYYRLSLNRIWDKAYRQVYAQLVGRLEETVPTDPDGTITSTVASSFEQTARIPLDDMIRVDELSGYRVFVDNKQNLFISNGALSVTVDLLASGIVHTITVNLGFTQNI